MAKKNEKVSHSLEIDESIDLHKRGWILQRIGWGLLFVTLIAASLGLFGSGVLSKKKLTQDQNMLQYERFGRYETQHEIKIIAMPSNQKVVILFSQHYLENVEIESIVPEPAETKTSSEAVQYIYNTSSPLTVTFYFKPQNAGNVNTIVGVNDSKFDMNQFIYP